MRRAPQLACSSVALLSSARWRLPRLTRKGQAIAADWPSFYCDVLAKDPETYAIWRRRSSSACAAVGTRLCGCQTVYHKARFGSSIARDHKADNPDLFMKRTTFFRRLLLSPPGHLDRSLPPTEGAGFIPTPDYRTVGVPCFNFYMRCRVLYLDASQRDGSRRDGCRPQLVHQSLGAAAARSIRMRNMEAYRVPDGPSLATRTSSTPAQTVGGRRKRHRGPPYRWADTRDGQVPRFAAFQSECRAAHYARALHALQLQAARTFTVAVDGTAVDAVTLAPNASQEIALDLDLSPGMHLISLSTPQPPIPIPNNGGHDNRLLSFGVRQLSVAETG